MSRLTRQKGTTLACAGRRFGPTQEERLQRSKPMVIGLPDSGDPINPTGRDFKRLDLFAVQAFLNLFPSRIFSGRLEPAQVARKSYSTQSPSPHYSGTNTS